MTLTKNAHWWAVSPSSYQLAELFAETMRKRQISFVDWYELVTAPLEDSSSTEAQDIIPRLIYAIRHGLVKIVEKL